MRVKIGVGINIKGGAIAFDLDSYSYEGKSFSIASEETAPRGVFFNPAGSKMYIIGGNAIVYQYSLSTPHDVSTASFDSKSFDVSTQDTDPREVVFSPDGTKFFVSGFVSQTIFQYSMSTPDDVSTASFASKSFNHGLNNAQGVFIRTDGLKFYICDTSPDVVRQYSMSSAFDMSTASSDSKSVSVAGESAQMQQVFFNPAGTRMFIIDSANNTVFQYSLSTAHDVSTASFDSKSFDGSNEETTPTSIFFKDNGEKFYTVGFANDTVFQYTL